MKYKQFFWTTLLVILFSFFSTPVLAQNKQELVSEAERITGLYEDGKITELEADTRLRMIESKLLAIQEQQRAKSSNQNRSSNISSKETKMVESVIQNSLLRSSITQVSVWSRIWGAIVTGLEILACFVVFLVIASLKDSSSGTSSRETIRDTNRGAPSPPIRGASFGGNRTTTRTQGGRLPSAEVPNHLT